MIRLYACGNGLMAATGEPDSIFTHCTRVHDLNADSGARQPPRVEKHVTVLVFGPIVSINLRGKIPY